jgi:hypothetical protein
MLNNPTPIRSISYTIPADLVTTLATPTNIVNLPVEANIWYAIEIHTATACNNTGGLKFGFISPTSSMYNFVADGMANAVTARARGQYNADGITAQVFNNVNNSIGFVIFRGTFKAPTTGSLQVQFQSTTTGQTSTVYAVGTYFTLNRIN